MKRYALIADGIVKNVMAGRPAADDDKYPYVRNDLPVRIGDAYENGVFLRDGRELHTPLENATTEIFALSRTGAAQVQAHCKDTGDDPAADTGIFVRGAEAWEAGKTYAANDLFEYNGAMGFVKQGHISQETWIPFSPGTESLYGARPAPDADGVFPWVYNMAAGVGMRVKDPDDGQVYACTQAISDMIYKPHEIPAHFEKE